MARRTPSGVTICRVTNRNVFSSKPRLVCIAAAFLFMVVAGSTERVYLQEAPNRAAQDRLELLPVQGNISMLAGAGGNITVQVGRDGVLLVDSGVATMSEKVVEAIRNLSQRSGHLHRQHHR